MEFKNTCPTRECLVKPSYYFQSFHVYFCRKQVIFFLLPAVPFCWKQIAGEPEPFILSQIFADDCKGTFFPAVLPYFNISHDTSCITYNL